MDEVSNTLNIEKGCFSKKKTCNKILKHAWAFAGIKTRNHQSNAKFSNCNNKIKLLVLNLFYKEKVVKKEIKMFKNV